ncbi:MAG: HAMP domain-containing histidine kinase, partial [Kiritimatiellae bacterium]|nr:HAMP domain-containing histidine kinase [Kiritimatiellia bacterium]
VEAFVGALRREIASVPYGEAPVRLALGRAAYCFAPLKAWKGVYVGYEVDRPEFAKTVREILSGFSGGGIRLTARGPGFEETPHPQVVTDVVVSDSFSGAGSPASGTPVLEGIRGRLAEGSLASPFDSIRIAACAEDPERVARFSAQQVRLHAWAVALLAGGVVTGVWLLIRETAAELRRMRTRSDFVIGVSHDLRTPVSSVKMLAETLYTGRITDSQTARKFLGVIAREADRLNQLIERVLYFVRLDQDAIEHAPRPTEIGRFVREVVQSFLTRYSISAEGNEATGGAGPIVSLHVADGLPQVKIDEGAMTQVLLNLLDNAVKYTRPGVPPQVQVEVGCVGSAWWLLKRRRRVVIAVRDNGIGIGRRDRRRIFRRYYRTPEARRSNVSGVGLGLALCRRIIKMHGGRIGVQSKPGEGSTFFIALPVVGCG